MLRATRGPPYGHPFLLSLAVRVPVAWGYDDPALALLTLSPNPFLWPFRMDGARPIIFCFSSLSKQELIIPLPQLLVLGG